MSEENQIKRMQSLEEAYADIAGLSDRELDAHIGMLRTTAHDFSRSALWGGTTVGTFGVGELIALINLAAAEKNSRSSAKIATAALVIGAAGIFVALIGAFT